MATVLALRGVNSYDEALLFFRPSLQHLHNPFLMKDMREAVDRVFEAMKNGERILVFGDYDVDGTTAVALVFQFLESIYQNLEYYIPDRYSEGYGISFKGIDYAHENGFSLIIALDCGIKSIAHVDYARERGIDFIICDHHLPGNKLPKAIAVLDAKRSDCPYPFKELSGCGVGLKLCQAIAIEKKMPDDSWAQYLDLACVSIASDIVPITGENRTIAWFGLKKINENPSVGIAALMEFYTKKDTLSIADIVFSIGPRINAAGRIADAKAAVRLLMEKDKEKAREFAEELNNRNIERRGLDQTITDEALMQIATDELHKGKRSTVVFQPGWHKGVVGIVASRLIEKHYKPTIVLTESDGNITGSARSVRGFDIHGALEECSSLLLQWGGHHFAAGLSLTPDNLNAFIQAFEQAVANRITPDSLVPVLHYDLETPLSTFDAKFMKVMKQFAPFGPGNMNPLFVTRGVMDTGYAAEVGKGHLKLNIRSGNTIFGGIAFGLADYLPEIKKGKPFDIIYHVDENWFSGELRGLQLDIKDIKIN